MTSAEKFNLQLLPPAIEDLQLYAAAGQGFFLEAPKQPTRAQGPKKKGPRHNCWI
jgi:hypothetical protein